MALLIQSNAAETLGLTMGTSVAYTDAKYSKPENLRADLLAANSGQFIATGRPKWAGSAFIQYNTQPVFEGGYLSFRLDTAFQSKKSFYPNPDTAGAYAAEALGEDSYALFNGRIALTDIEMGGAKSTIALWGKNLFDERRMASAYDVRTAAVANFIPARAYGIDVTFEY